MLEHAARLRSSTRGAAPKQYHPTAMAPRAPSANERRNTDAADDQSRKRKDEPPPKVMYYGKEARSDSGLGDKGAVWARASERRNTDAGKSEPFLSPQGSLFRGQAASSQGNPPLRDSAMRRTRTASPSMVWRKKVTFDHPIAIGAAKKVEQVEEETDFVENHLTVVYSHCMETCCWQSTQPSGNIDSYIHIDCRFADNDFEPMHDGRNETVQSNMLKAPGVDGMNWTEICFRVKRHLKRDCKSLLVGLWCEEGRRSSVAVAELIFAILKMESNAGDNVDLEHTALDHHHLRHGGCAACEASSLKVHIFQAAKQIWDEAITD